MFAVAIDGTHIQIKAPDESDIDYFSRYHKLFLDFATGHPGSLHDARVLRNSTLYRRVEGNKVLNSPTIQISHHEIRPHLIGDSGYRLGPWLQKRFPKATRDQGEISFNRELTSARVSVECAFGMNFAVKTAIACVVLHNFCIRNGDYWDDSDENDDDDGENGDTNVMQDGDNV